METELNNIFFTGEEEINAELERWRAQIEAARRWAVNGPGGEYEDGPDGHTLFLKGAKSSARHAVVLSPGIGPAPGPDKLGSGPILLRRRDGDDLEDDVEGVCYINFTTGIPAGTRITVVPDGADWTIPGANCPPSSP